MSIKIMDTESAIKEKFLSLDSLLDERSRRCWVATEAKALGYGGISIVSRATGITRNTIMKGLKELKIKSKITNQRVRRKGGGRKKITEKDGKLKSDLEHLVEPTSRGDPESPLRYTIKSVRNLAAELVRLGHKVTYPTVAMLLHELKYSLQANSKKKEGTAHPDRNAQFEHINNNANKYLDMGDPVISVDTKKKEIIGDFKNQGRDWRPKGDPEIVQMHDFPDPSLGKVAPYGVYDLNKNEGWVNVGIDHDTAQFSVESIRQWWKHLGKKSYPDSKRIFITADCGGSNGVRSRLWKIELQKLANETDLEIRIAHFPPGTSKWNKIEHRLFSFITMNWRGKPLYDLATVINLIAATKTETGLKVYARLDKRKYEKGIKVTDEELAQVNIQNDEFHGEWNYIIGPIQNKNR